MCDLCGKVFRKAHGLKYHMEGVHEKQRKFQCPHCPHKFLINAKLTEHMRIHTGEKPFKCFACDYRSNRHGNVRLHCKKVHKVEHPNNEDHVIVSQPLLPGGGGGGEATIVYEEVFINADEGGDEDGKFGPEGSEVIGTDKSLSVLEDQMGGSFVLAEVVGEEAQEDVRVERMNVIIEDHVVLGEEEDSSPANDEVDVDHGQVSPSIFVARKSRSSLLSKQVT